MTSAFTLTNFLDGLSWWLTQPDLARDLNLRTYQELTRGLLHNGASMSAAELAFHIEVVARSSQGLSTPRDEFVELLHVHLPEILVQVFMGVQKVGNERTLRIIPAHELERILSIFRQYGFPASASDAGNLLHCLWGWLYPPFVSNGENLPLEHLSSYRDHIETSLEMTHPALRVALGHMTLYVAVDGDGTISQNPIPGEMKMIELCLIGRDVAKGYLTSVLDRPHGLAVFGTSFRDLARHIATFVELKEVDGQSYRLSDEEASLYAPGGRLGSAVVKSLRELPPDPDPVGTRLFLSNIHLLNGIARWVVEYEGPNDFLLSVHEAAKTTTGKFSVPHVAAINATWPLVTGFTGVKLECPLTPHNIQAVSEIHRQHVDPYVVDAGGMRMAMGAVEGFRPFITFLFDEVCGRDIVSCSWLAHLIDPWVFTPVHRDEEVVDIDGYFRYAQLASDRLRWRIESFANYASSILRAFFALAGGSEWKDGSDFPVPLTLVHFLNSLGRQQPRFIEMLDPDTPALPLTHFARVPLLDSYRVLEIFMRGEHQVLSQLIMSPTLDEPDELSSGLTPSELPCLPFMPRAIPRRPDGSAPF